MARAHRSRASAVVGHLSQLSPRELATLVHVVAALVVVELTIRWVDLPRLTRLLGFRIDLTAPAQGSDPLAWEELPAGDDRALRCTYLAAGAWPFATGPCLRRSLVAGHLLRRHRPSLRLGMVGEGERIHAHSWIEIDGRPLEDVGGYQVFRSAVDA